jgi:hypothetical protein
VDAPFGLARGLSEGGEETFAVRVVVVDFLATIEAQLARLEEEMVSTSRTVNSEN